MRIGIFTNNYLPMRGGVTTSIEVLRRGCEIRGHQAYVFAPRAPGYTDSSPRVFRYPSVPALTYPGFFLPIPFSSRIERKARSLGVDVFHAQHPFLLGPAARRLAGRTGRPLVFTYHTRYEKYVHYVPLSRRSAERRALRWSIDFASSADLVIAPSAWIKDFLLGRGLTTPIEVVVTGVEEEIFTPGDPRAARAALGFPPEEPVLLYVGRLDREKSVNVILDAFGHIAAALPQARLLLVGQGSERRRLETLAQQSPAADRICFIGPKPHGDLPTFYRAADLFVFASETETQGLVVTEAMACGTPVVAVRAPGVNEAVQDGRTGILTKPDPRELADASIRLLLDHDARRVLGAHARRRAVEKFSAGRQVERLLALYTDLLTGRRPAGAGGG